MRSEWGDEPERTLKTFGVGVVLAVTLAQLCLLLALAGHGRLRAVLWPTIACAAVVGVLVCAMILGGIDAESIWRVLGVLAILDVLGTLVTIALAKFGRGATRVESGAQPTAGSVVLSGAQARAFEELARRTGRPPADLVSEALDRYLQATRAHD